MHLQAVVVLALAGAVAAVGLCSEQAAAPDTDVAAHGQRKGVQGIALVGGLGQGHKKAHYLEEDRLEGVQAAVELRLVQGEKDVAVALGRVQGPVAVAAVLQAGGHKDIEDLGVAELGRSAGGRSAGLAAVLAIFQVFVYHCVDEHVLQLIGAVVRHGSSSFKVGYPKLRAMPFCCQALHPVFATCFTAQLELYLIFLAPYF